MDFKVPELGEGVYEAELVRWLVKPGDAIKRGQGLMEVMTDKATFEVPSSIVGTVDELRAEPGEQIKVGQAILSYTPAGQVEESVPADKKKAGKRAHAAPASSSPAPEKGGNGPVMTAAPPAALSAGLEGIKAAPSVRLMARKLGIDLANIHGSGPGGRVLIDDVTTQIKQAPATAPPPPALDFGKPGTRIKLIGLRRKIAEHMVRSKQTIPHYSYMDECDVSDLVRLRSSLRETFAKAGAKLTYLAFFVKAVVRALQDVPIVNATLDEEAGEIVLHDRYHIGIAVATPQGLVVPVIKDADKKDLVQIAREVDRLSEEARIGKIKLDDLRGSTFTVTSIGSIGGLVSTPIIHHPEVGILGIGKVVKRPVYDEHGNLHPADIIFLSFSFDHRVVDGAVGASFGNALIRHLQNPAALLVALTVGL